MPSQPTRPRADPYPPRALPPNASTRHASRAAQKIRTRFLATPAQSATLEALVENEKGEKKRTATEGLLWLLRGLKFTQIALARSQADKSEELTVSFTKAYEATLKKFHSFVVKPLFSVRALPVVPVPRAEPD